MSPNAAELIKLVAWMGVIVGVLGVFIPVVPGTILIFASALLWAWADGFHAIGWVPLTALLGLTVVAEGAHHLMVSLGARRAGATWKGVAASAAGAVVGLVFFSLPGALIGAVGALLAVDYRQHRGDLGAASKLTLGVLLGYLGSYAIQFAIALTMLAIFAWNALRG
jgi:uncharacterized protein